MISDQLLLEHINTISHAGRTGRRSSSSRSVWATKQELASKLKQTQREQKGKKCNPCYHGIIRISSSVTAQPGPHCVLSVCSGAPTWVSGAVAVPLALPVFLAVCVLLGMLQAQLVADLKGLSHGPHDSHSLTLGRKTGKKE